MAFGCWISPEGKLVDVTFSSHIEFVLKYPHYFGKTDEEYRKIYADYEEQWGCEGSAREEIITDVIVNYGWIRARKYLKSGEYYSINVNDLNDTNKHLLALFAEGLLGGHYGVKESVNSIFRITDLKNNQYFNFEEALAWKDSSNDKIEVVNSLSWEKYADWRAAQS